ncbi:MAG: porin [Chromatiales bacterium]|jgi:hypothetical protein
MIKKSLLASAIAATLAGPAVASATDSTEMAEVKRMIEQMRLDYEKKMQVLEQRLQAAERKAETAAVKAETMQQTGMSPASASDRNRGSVTSGSAFNPQISVILDSNYYHDNVDGEGSELLSMADGISHAHGAGHDHDHGGHSHAAAEQGFNFRSAEVAFMASVDNYFDATALLAIDADGSVDLEEAWFQTRSLPYGLKVKAGKFLSDIGYANNQHPHSWDFTDQNLAYLNLLGDHGLRDTGVQLTWLPDWSHYTLFGVEVFQGEQEKLGALAEVDEDLAAELDGAGLSEDDLALAAEKDGPRLYTAFVKYAPELGYDHALQLGAWGGWSNQHQEIHGDAADGDLHTLEGDAWMWGLDGIYKYDAKGAYGQGDFKLQGEYLWQRKDLNLQFHQANPALVGAERKFTEDGFYLQGQYGFAPRWQAGLRYDVVGLVNKLESSGSTLRDWDESDRWTAALTWTPTEYSQFRFQYASADITIDGESNDYDYVYLQYLMSLGSHGAHKF